MAVWALMERACAVCTLYWPAPAAKFPMPEAILPCTVDPAPPQPPQPPYRPYCAWAETPPAASTAVKTMVLAKKCRIGEAPGQDDGDRPSGYTADGVSASFS